MKYSNLKLPQFSEYLFIEWQLKSNKNTKRETLKVGTKQFFFVRKDI